MAVIGTTGAPPAEAAPPVAAVAGRLPRRDLVLLPLIVVATAILLCGAAEFAARWFFPEHLVESCARPDPILGIRIAPNCASDMKTAEGPPVVDAFNECGYRTPQPCGPKPAGTIRIAALGSSFTEGFLVPYDQTFTARAAAALQRRCRVPVEVQNMGIAGAPLLNDYYRVDEALSLHPDLVMMGLVPFELEERIDPAALARRDHPAPVTAEPAATPPGGLLWRAREWITGSRSALVAEHFMLQDRATFIRLWMVYGDKADYLRPPFSPAWHQRFADLDAILGGMAAKLQAAKVPFLLVIGPQRIQAALLDPAGRPPGIDPYAFDREVAAIAQRHGIRVVDTLRDFARLPHPEQLFYTVDGHVDGAGQAVLAKGLEAGLGRAIPALGDCGGTAGAGGRMSVASGEFLLFALLAVLAYNLAQPLWWRQAALLVANLAFLASFSTAPAAYLPLAGFIAVGYGGLAALQRGRARSWFWPLLAGELIFYFWLKKYGFLPVPFLSVPYATIGLSYIFFRVLHLLIDARSGNLPERIGPLAYLNYLLNFTTLVAGPIQLYPEFAASQLAPRRPLLSLADAGRAVERIIRGLFKAVVVSALLSAAHGEALRGLAASDPLLKRALEGLWIVASYQIYLYFNFSGYTDIVIGVARFLRLTLPENFDRPFAALNFLDFWGRWHMTLSGWFKTYLYNPLVKALMTRFPSPQAGPLIAVAAFFVAFFLIGLWHGRTALFVAYGLLLGLGASGNKLWQVWLARRLGRKGYRALAAVPAYRLAARGLTMAWLSTALVCFWADAGEIRDLGARLGPVGLALSFAIAVPAWGACLELLEQLRRGALAVAWDGQPLLFSRYLRTSWATALLMAAGATALLLQSPAPDVVYKTF